MNILNPSNIRLIFWKENEIGPLVGIGLMISVGNGVCVIDLARFVGMPGQKTIE